MGQIRWTEKSVKHLEDIYEYIAHDSKIYATRFIKSLIKSIKILENQPFAGRIVPEIENQNIREILYKNYRIVYKILIEDNVEILAVYHGAMNFSPDKLK